MRSIINLLYKTFSFWAEYFDLKYEFPSVAGCWLSIPVAQMMDCLSTPSAFPQPAHAQFQLNEKLFVPSVCACAVTAWWEDLYSISLRMRSYSLMKSFLLSQYAHAQFQLDEKLFVLSVWACAVSAWWEALYSLSLRMRRSSSMRSSLFPLHAKVKLDEKLVIS